MKKNGPFLLSVFSAFLSSCESKKELSHLTIEDKPLEKNKIVLETNGDTIVSLKLVLLIPKNDQEHLQITLERKSSGEFVGDVGGKTLSENLVEDMLVSLEELKIHDFFESRSLTYSGPPPLRVHREFNGGVLEIRDIRSVEINRLIRDRLLD